MDRTEALARLREVKPLRAAAAEAQRVATEATNKAIEDALRAGLKPGEIATELEVSDSHIRAVRRGAGIAPDPRYAHLKPPVRSDT